ncbi:MAG TPA: hypothetical protein VFP56_09105 [Candidatus Limnocylindrales bacterium]|nr:hypothetical protein [Candidatus Limnocylindrales bacterium]
MNRYRVLAGASGALWVAIAGAVATVTIALFFWIGQPFGTINDLALIVLVLSLGPVMLAHYELGGVVPLWPARVSLAAAVAAAAGWAVLQLAFVLGIVEFDYDRAATGPFVVSNLLLVVIGLWIGGASLLAGRWLPPLVRALGVVAGVGTVLAAAGLLLGGMGHPLTLAGGIGYQVVLPAWAFLLSRVFRARAAESGALPSSASVSA